MPAAGRTAPSMSLVVVASTNEYRAATSLVGAEAQVLEVGSAHGTTADKLAARCALVLGVDKGAPEISEAQKRFKHRENLLFCHCDALDVATVRGVLAELAAEGRAANLPPSQPPFDFIFVDVSGVAQLSFLVPLLESLEKAWHPSVMVVKSQRLARLQELCNNGQRLFLPTPPRPAKRLHQSSTQQVARPLRRTAREGRLYAVGSKLLRQLELSSVAWDPTLISNAAANDMRTPAKVSTNVEKRYMACFSEAPGSPGKTPLIKCTVAFSSKRPVIVLSCWGERIKLSNVSGLFADRLDWTWANAGQITMLLGSQQAKKDFMAGFPAGLLLWVTDAADSEPSGPEGPEQVPNSHVTVVCAGSLSQHKEALLELSPGHYICLSPSTLAKAIVTPARANCDSQTREQMYSDAIGLAELDGPACGLPCVVGSFTTAVMIYAIALYSEHHH